jgi:hypothetical protein
VNRNTPSTSAPHNFTRVPHFVPQTDNPLYAFTSRSGPPLFQEPRRDPKFVIKEGWVPYALKGVKKYTTVQEIWDEYDKGIIQNICDVDGKVVAQVQYAVRDIIAQMPVKDNIQVYDRSQDKHTRGKFMALVHAIEDYTASYPISKKDAIKELQAICNKEFDGRINQLKMACQLRIRPHPHPTPIGKLNTKLYCAMEKIWKFILPERLVSHMRPDVRARELPILEGYFRGQNNDFSQTLHEGQSVRDVE